MEWLRKLEQELGLVVTHFDKANQHSKYNLNDHDEAMAQFNELNEELKELYKKVNDFKLMWSYIFEE